MATQSEKEAEYHCGIGGLLRAAYGRDFDMLDTGKCKRKFTTFNDWYDSLSPQQKQRVDKALEKSYPKTNFL